MKAIFISLFIIVAGNMFAQSSEDVVLKKIPDRAAKKVAKAEKLLAKGNSILKDAKKYDEEIDANKAKYSKRKVKKLTGKSVKIKLKAAPYLEDGYVKKSKSLLKVVKDLRKVNPQLASRLKEIEVNSNKKLKEAKKLYRKADDVSSKSRSIDYYDSGNKELVDAIGNMIGGLKLVYNIDVTENEGSGEAIVDSVSAKNKTVEPKIAQEKEVMAAPQTAIASEGQNVATVAVAAGTGVVAAAAVSNENSKKTIEEQQEPVSSENAKVTDEERMTKSEVVDANDTVTDVQAEENKVVGDVFFTIQFIADKKPVSEDVLRSKYSGDQEIVKMESDGWYRYSAGKFTDLQKAKEVMKSENIKGFIVAYKNDKRITISEAIGLLK